LNPSSFRLRKLEDLISKFKNHCNWKPRQFASPTSQGRSGTCSVYLVNLCRWVCRQQRLQSFLFRPELHFLKGHNIKTSDSSILRDHLWDHLRY
jgi:hypothetical protein